jgi:Zn-dependent peptidase ImmA (M78 family)
MSVDFRVRPLGWDAIGKITDDLRAQFGLSNEPYFPVVEFIEKVLDQHLSYVSFQVGDYETMNGAEGLTDPGGAFIMLREDVYLGACNGKGRPRFTAAHELGHLILHTKVPFARIGPKEDPAAYRRSEPQANQFAAELLMPRDLILASDTAETIAQRHGVSIDAATHRLDFMRKKGLV